MSRESNLTNLQVFGSIGGAIALGVIAQWYLVAERHLALGLVFWMCALGAFFFGLRRAGSPTGHENEPFSEGPCNGSRLPRVGEGALFLTVIGSAVFFRLYKFGSIPPGLNHDAAWNGLYAIRITQGIPFSPYVPEAWGRETMFHYIIAFFQLLLGPTQFAIQLAAIVIGIATVVTFYFFVRYLFGIRVALVATFLLGASGWHFTLSKVGWRAILVPLFEVLIFYFLVKAIHERRARNFILAGIFLGLSLITYDGARILPFIALAYLLYEMLRNPVFLRSNYGNLALFGLTALLAFSPLGWYALHNWDAFTARASSTWIGAEIERTGSIQPLVFNIGSALLMFNFRANGNDFFVEEPLLDVPVSVFFVLGLVYSISRWRQRGHFLLLTMLLFTLFVGVASSPNGNRCLGAVVPATAISGIFLVRVWYWLADTYPRYRNSFTIALVGVLLYTGYASYGSYLGPDRREQWGFYPETTRVGLYMREIAKDYEIYAVADNWPRDTLTYLSYQREGDPFWGEYMYYTDASELLHIQPAHDRGTAFVIEAVPKNFQILNGLWSRFPDATLDEIYYPDGSSNVIAYALRVPREMPTTK